MPRSDLVDMWSLLRQIFLQLCKPPRPSDCGTMTVNVHLRRGKKHDVKYNMASCSACSHAVTDDKGLECDI